MPIPASRAGGWENRSGPCSNTSRDCRPAGLRPLARETATSYSNSGTERPRHPQSILHGKKYGNSDVQTFTLRKFSRFTEKGPVLEKLRKIKETLTAGEGGKETPRHRADSDRAHRAEGVLILFHCARLLTPGIPSWSWADIASSGRILFLRCQLRNSSIRFLAGSFRKNLLTLIHWRLSTTACMASDDGA